MAVDDTHLYWCEGVSSEGRFISAAPKDGTGPILTIGTWYDLSSPDNLVVDEQHVYWLFPEGTGVLRRVNKDGSDPISFPLPVTALGGRLDIGPLEDGGDALFIATHGCFQIVRMPKDGGPAQLWDISDLGNGGGGTLLGLQGQYVYCSNDDYIQRLDTTTGKVTLVVDDQRSGSPFIFIDQYMYIHANQPTPVTPPYIGRIDLSADKPSTVNLGPSFATSGGLFYDAVRKRLYWTTGLSGTDAHIGTYALDSDAPPELLFDKQDVNGGAAMDEDYLYWMGGTGLRRLKKW
jgi:streptogramin lyase